ncbi:MAG: hypothetical protein K1Y36_10505 [Blastocatellia bacterium]|nr:hypothetical protein [Blastocatellia bacterium]
MASFQDPNLQFGPIEVAERLLDLCEQGGFPPMLFLYSNFDLAFYLDALGFDVYSLTSGPSKAIDFSEPTVNMLPSGDNCHGRQTPH